MVMLILCSWGEKGHQKINGSAPKFFKSRLRHFIGWKEVLILHGSDADNRKRQDKNEAPRHYIDIDNYTDFINNLQITEDRNLAVQKYGIDFIVKNGTLPWVTDSTYNKLVENFKAKKWLNVMLTASDLGHFVGDGFMPLHITANYDGKMTGQAGIHSRYESVMINKYIDSIFVERQRITKVKDVPRFIFDYTYSNYMYKDSLLLADKMAFEMSGNIYDEVYYRQLWNSTRSFTGKMISGATKATAELIQSAWIEAGKPRLPKRIKPGE